MYGTNRELIVFPNFITYFTLHLILSNNADILDKVLQCYFSIVTRFVVGRVDTNILGKLNL